jgi:AbrB family looped-hinge helix DNA binding protein
MLSVFGPCKIAANGQVVIPKGVLEMIGLRPGESIYFHIEKDSHNLVTLVPATIANEWFEKGRELQD